MTKTIKILSQKIEKLKEKNDGTLEGGFASIKGGFITQADSTNQNWGCTNASNCTSSTNIGAGCTNSGTCIM